MSDIRVPSTTCWCRAAVRLVAIMSLSAGLAHAGSPVAVLTSPVPQMSYFGWSVAGSKKMAVVGAPWRYIAGPQIVGEAYLFDLKTGTLLQTLSNPNTLPNDNVTQDRFASAVAMGTPATRTARNSGWITVPSAPITNSPLNSGLRQTTMRSVSPGESTVCSGGRAVV